MLSLAHMTFMHADPLALIGLARTGGFDAVGIRLIDPAPQADHFPLIGDAALRRLVKAELEATGIALLDVEAIWLWPETEIAHVEPVLAVGAELGAKHVLVAGNDPDRRRMTDRFARICELAHGYGLGVGLEFIPYTTLNSLGSAVEALREAAQPNAGVLIDILHLMRSGGSPADIGALNPDEIAYGHLCDAPAASPGSDAIRAEARSARLYPGDGGLPLDAFLRAMPPGRPIALEAPASAYGGDDAARAQRAGAACRALLARSGRG